MLKYKYIQSTTSLHLIDSVITAKGKIEKERIIE
jgi:hypothetical protein